MEKCFQKFSTRNKKKRLCIYIYMHSYIYICKYIQFIHKMCVCFNTKLNLERKDCFRHMHYYSCTFEMCCAATGWPCSVIHSHRSTTETCLVHMKSEHTYMCFNILLCKYLILSILLDICLWDTLCLFNTIKMWLRIDCDCVVPSALKCFTFFKWNTRVNI